MLIRLLLVLADIFTPLSRRLRSTLHQLSDEHKREVRTRHPMLWRWFHGGCGC